MNSINLVSAANTEGRIDVGEATGSTEMLMFIYDLAPGQARLPITTSTTRSGSSSSRGRSWCARRMGSTQSIVASSSASRPVRKERTRS